MKQINTPKRRYTIILDTKAREEVVIYAKGNGTQAALDKYGISIATLKRWRANHNSNDPKRNLIRKYGHPRREEKYDTQCRIIRRWLYDNYKNNPNTYGLQGWTRLQLVHKIQDSMPQAVHPTTIYRLINYVINNKEKFAFYF